MQLGQQERLLLHGRPSRWARKATKGKYTMVRMGCQRGARELEYPFRWESARRSRLLLCGSRSRPPHPATGALAAPEPHESEALHRCSLHPGSPAHHQEPRTGTGASTRAVPGCIRGPRTDSGSIQYMLRHRKRRIPDFHRNRYSTVREQWGCGLPGTEFRLLAGSGPRRDTAPDCPLGLSGWRTRGIGILVRGRWAVRGDERQQEPGPGPGPRDP